MDLTIIVPTYNEGCNVKALADRILKIMSKGYQSYEIIFIDDSDDHTPLEIEKLIRKHSFIRLFHREKERGLSTAVVEGFIWFNIKLSI